MQDLIPAPRAQPRPERIELVMLILERQGRVLVCNSAALRLIPGSHALPVTALSNGDSPGKAAAALARRILGASTRLCAKAKIHHSITYRRLIAHLYYANVNFGDMDVPAPPDHQWRLRSDLDRLLTSALYRKALAA